MSQTILSKKKKMFGTFFFCIEFFFSFLTKKEPNLTYPKPAGQFLYIPNTAGEFLNIPNLKKKNQNIFLSSIFFLHKKTSKKSILGGSIFEKGGDLYGVRLGTTL